MESLTIHLLGAPEVRVGEQRLSLRTRKVLACLAVERRMHSRESLASGSLLKAGEAAEAQAERA